MQTLRKSEYHIHLGGSWPLEYLREIATTEEFNDLCAMIRQIDQGMDYHEAFQVFHLIGKIINTDQKVEDGVIALCKELIQDNVVYVELRTGLKDLGSGFRGYLEAVLRGMAKERIKVGVILSLRRDTPSPVASETIDLAIEYLNRGVIGIDVSGDSTVGDIRNIFPHILRAKSSGLPLTLHMGESPKELADLQMLELTTLKPERVGHAVHLCQEAKDWIKTHQILVEMCLTSAVKAGMIAEASEHPALQLLLDGQPVSICTDDPLIFNTSLSQEFALVSQLTNLSSRAIEETQRLASKYNFIPSSSICVSG